MLKENKNNIRRTWNILNNVTGNNSVSTGLPTHFVNDNNKFIKNKNEVVNEFNSFFVNAQPNLAHTIKKRNDGRIEGGWNGGSKVLQSVFLGEVSENEIRSIIAKVQKYSTKIR